MDKTQVRKTILQELEHNILRGIVTPVGAYILSGGVVSDALVEIFICIEVEISKCLT